jgi:hypothetical protein
MGGNSRLRSVVLLRASSGTAGGADAGSRDVGDLWGHHWSVARDGRECAGLLGSGVDRRSKESRSAVDVSPPRAVAASHPGASRATTAGGPDAVRA